jgi:hypothetical protein
MNDERYPVILAGIEANISKIEINIVYLVYWRRRVAYAYLKQSKLRRIIGIWYRMSINIIDNGFLLRRNELAQFKSSSSVNE